VRQAAGDVAEGPAAATDALDAGGVPGPERPIVPGLERPIAASDATGAGPAAIPPAAGAGGCGRPGPGGPGETNQRAQGSRGPEGVRPAEPCGRTRQPPEARDPQGT